MPFNPDVDSTGGQHTERKLVKIIFIPYFFNICFSLFCSCSSFNKKGYKFILLN